MPIANLDNININYETHGEGEPLVLIAGMGSDHKRWDHLVKQLSHQFKVITFDNRGTGRSSIPKGDYSIDQMAHDVALLCKHLSLKSAYFIGSSMGGYILQTLCYQHPTLVKKAVISCSGLNWNGAVYNYLQAELAMIRQNIDPGLIMRVATSWLFSYHYLIQTERINQFIEIATNNPYPFTVTGYSGQYAAVSTFDSTSWAANINIPTLVVGATDDAIMNDRIFNELANKIPNSQKYQFEKTGHMPDIERPDEFITLICKFFYSTGIKVV